MNEILQVSLALAVGLLIGVERGWQERGSKEGNHIAGLRTFGLIGLLGGIWGILSSKFGDVLIGFSFLAMTALLISAYVLNRSRSEDRGITSLVAALITFSLGVMAVKGFENIAVACAVVTASLLSLKSRLHHWIETLEQQEIHAALKLLLISVVLLPVLPNQGYGPWQALNPYLLWWMVVLIASLSFAGYFAMKLAGAKQGIMLTSMFGGLVSSTALTLYLSRLSREIKLQRVIAAGVLIAAATMFPRVMIEVAAINPALLKIVWLPMSGMMIISYGYAYLLWRKDGDVNNFEYEPKNPFELGSAIRFGLLLASIMLSAMAIRHWFGDTGLYALSAISGIIDVDAITLSIAKMTTHELPLEVGGKAILLAVIVNTAVKMGLVMSLGASLLKKYALAGYLLTVLTGGLIFFIS